MTDREYLTDRTRDQIADALGGCALADIFIHLWDSITKDEAEQLQAIGYALGKLPAFYNEFQHKARARTIHCILAIAGNIHSCRGHRAKPSLVNCLIEWAHALTS